MEILEKERLTGLISNFGITRSSGLKVDHIALLIDFNVIV
jgi:hypothetical protein